MEKCSPLACGRINLSSDTLPVVFDTRGMCRADVLAEQYRQRRFAGYGNSASTALRDSGPVLDARKNRHFVFCSQAGLLFTGYAK